MENETKEISLVNNLNNVMNINRTKVQLFTTIESENVKDIYNLENANCDFKINDCKGQKIRVVDVLIKEFVKELEEPEYNEQGEITKEFDIKKVCILIDDQGKTYVTASKIFTNQMLAFISNYGIETIKNGLDIEIIEKSIKNSSNKSLGFKLV